MALEHFDVSSAGKCLSDTAGRERIFTRAASGQLGRLTSAERESALEICALGRSLAGQLCKALRGRASLLGGGLFGRAKRAVCIGPWCTPIVHGQSLHHQHGPDGEARRKLRSRFSGLNGTRPVAAFRLPNRPRARCKNSSAGRCGRQDLLVQPKAKGSRDRNRCASR